MKKAIFFTLIVSIILSSCFSGKEKDNTISLSGAFALYPMVIKWTEEYKKENEDIRFNISAGGAGKGMADAIAETVDLGMFSREITQEELDKGVWYVGLCKDAVIPTISDQNPYIDSIKRRGLTRDEFRAIFITGEIESWAQLFGGENDAEIVVYTRSDACGAAGTWADYIGGKQEDLMGIGVHGDPGLAEAVGKDKMGIGFNNTAYVYDIKTGKKHPGLEVVPFDLNENGSIEPNEYFYDSFKKVLNAIEHDVYPSPPSRELYFVSHGKPKKQATLDFIKWTLTEGQKYIKEAGYVPISGEKINEYLRKLD